MALRKSINLANGFTVEYHKITRVEIDGVAKSGEIATKIYKDQAARLAGSQPAAGDMYLIPAGAITAAFLNGQELIVACYEYLKTLPHFTGAEDV